jgi:hypothetical protein
MNISRTPWMRAVPAGFAALMLAALLMVSSFAAPVAAQDATPAPADGMGDAMVRVIHASPDAPAVDVYVDGAIAIENLAFGEATDWIPLPGGEYQVQVAPTGTSADDAVIDAMLALEGGTYYDVAAVGEVANIAASVTVVDASPVADGMTRVRVIHASPDAPAVDVAVTDGPVLFSDIAFPDASEYAEVDAGTYDLQVRPTGTEDVALDLPGVALDAGVVYDIFAIGTLADGTLSVLPLATTPEAAVASGEMVGEAMVRVVHASPDAPEVDIYLNGELAIEGLAFGTATDLVALPGGDYQVQVTPAGADASEAVIDATLTLEAGKAYQVAAVRELINIQAAVVEINLEEVAEGQARIQVVHASPDAPGVDVAVAGGPVLVEDLEFPNASGYLEVDAGTYDLQVRPTGTEDVALDLPGVVLEAGVVYDVIAIGTLADGTLNVMVLQAMPMGGME